MELIQATGLGFLSMVWVAAVVVAAQGQSATDLDYAD
jgi:hypothetical protein